MRRIDIEPGRKFGRWSVLREAASIGRRRMLWCRCECGIEKKVNLESLRGGRSISCGCLTVDRFKPFEQTAMAAKSGTLTADMVRSLLTYDPETGVFARRIRTNNAVQIGQQAGGRSNGYVFIKLFQRRYVAHRLAWLYVYGEWPQSRLDHKNRVKSDNWIRNLRPATQSQNIANTGCRRDSAAGVKGVVLHSSGRWRARCRVDGISHHLGMFGTKEEAHAAYVAFASKAFGSYFCDGRNVNER